MERVLISMSDISNIVRRRLEATSVPQVHPEPDILAAYLERSLTEAERTEVVRHLAVCADCREVALLSLPALAEPAGITAMPARRSLWFLGLRWAALAA